MTLDLTPEERKLAAEALRAHADELFAYPTCSTDDDRALAMLALAEKLEAKEESDDQ